MGEKIVYRGPDTTFYNSQVLFVEYHDVLQTPWYTLLLILSKHEKIKTIFDLTEIEGLNHIELYEWYINRKHRNIFKNFPFIGGEEYPSDEQLDDFLWKNEVSSDALYNGAIGSFKLNFWNILKHIAVVDKQLIKRIYIYTESENTHVRDIVKSEFIGTNVSYKSGPFKDILKDIPNDSTFVLSDMSKMHILKEQEKLLCSSVLLCDGYRYNKDENREYVFNYEEEMKDTVFKFNFFNGLYK